MIQRSSIKFSFKYHIKLRAVIFLLFCFLLISFSSGYRAAFGERRDSSPLIGKKGSAIESAEERSLAHSAQMYHYQQQKQQMLAMEQ